MKLIWCFSLWGLAVEAEDSVLKEMLTLSSRIVFPSRVTTPWRKGVVLRPSLKTAHYTWIHLTNVVNFFLKMRDFNAYFSRMVCWKNQTNLTILSENHNWEGLTASVHVTLETQKPFRISGKAVKCQLHLFGGTRMSWLLILAVSLLWTLVVFKFLSTWSHLFYVLQIPKVPVPAGLVEIKSQLSPWYREKPDPLRGKRFPELAVGLSSNPGVWTPSRLLRPHLFHLWSDNSEGREKRGRSPFCPHPGAWTSQDWTSLRGPCLAAAHHAEAVLDAEVGHVDHQQCLCQLIQPLLQHVWGELPFHLGQGLLQLGQDEHHGDVITLEGQLEHLGAFCHSPIGGTCLPWYIMGTEHDSPSAL